MNRQIAELGPRAALLLGMLASPRTACELYDLVDAATLLDIDAIDDFVTGLVGFRGGSTRLVIRGILDGGTMEVVAQLTRLEAAGVVGRIGEVSYDQCIWWRVPPDAWPSSA